MKLLTAGVAALALVALFATPAEARDHRSNSILRMQIGLAQLGHYTGPQDGIFGSLTKQAIKDFQREKHLAISGKPTSATLAALDAMTHKNSRTQFAVNGGNAVPGAHAVAYYANPWTNTPQYIYPGMTYAVGR